ncbi:hypothetical protein ED733_001034 [Metarhizium rileyi]|uniref:Uncharacterized protein n=1 Tax=Metarhizium rileyi (strain RCEF 4871) TaxID=1649241 RepID=A0A5C6G0I4_METRR|nr:hypothetical protein ED733_001034 [Metarhizium rileyi]
MYQAVKAPTGVSAVESRQETNDPCALISKAFEAIPKNLTSDKPIILNLRPSVGNACRKALPLLQRENIALLDYLQPYIAYQSTIELLKDPPPEYLLPGVDLMGGMQAIRQRLQKQGYQSQLDVMTDLQNLFVASSDNHFGYTPGLFTAFRQSREGLDVVSVSTNGLDMPQIYAAKDINGPENKTYTPSPIDTIDGQDVFEFLEKESMGIPQGHQDPDARFNSLFNSIPVKALDRSGMATASIHDIPDQHVIKHKNGTSRVVINSLTTLPKTNLSGIRSVQDYQKRFELPPQDKPTAPKPPDQGPKRPPRDALPGYPKSTVKHPDEFVTTYLLNDTELQDTTVVSILSFVSLVEKNPLSDNLNLSLLVRQFEDVIDETANLARSQGRDKLIIDMSANPGGSLDLADVAYTAFFPGAPFDAFDRYRINDGVEFMKTAFEPNETLGILIADEGKPRNAKNETIESPEALLAPQLIKGQNLSMEFHRDLFTRYLTEPDVFLHGYGPKGKNDSRSREPPWKPENTVIVTDGLCASACTIFTGLMTRNLGIRTIALGGRPMNKPMQAMGGVKGTEAVGLGDIKGVMTDAMKSQKETQKGNSTGIEQPMGNSSSCSIPSVREPPLLPFLEDPGNGGSANTRNAYSRNDVDGFPLHFKYEAANCKLFYTREMILDIKESWKRVANTAFRNGPCVPGSTVNQDGTMGNTALGFDPEVRCRAPGIPRPTLKG